MSHTETASSIMEAVKIQPPISPKFNTLETLIESMIFHFLREVIGCYRQVMIIP